jgi:hypothetical protein
MGATETTAASHRQAPAVNTVGRGSRQGCAANGSTGGENDWK